MRSGNFRFAIDLTDCFFNWRVRPQDPFLLVFYTPARQQYGKFDYLAHVSNNAPSINDGSVKEICPTLRSNTGIVLTDFVDDLLGSADDGKPAQGLGLIYEGRLICYYSYESDLGNGWEDQIIYNDPEEVRQKALRMGANIISYVFSSEL